MSDDTKRCGRPHEHPCGIDTDCAYLDRLDGEGEDTGDETAALPPHVYGDAVHGVPAAESPIPLWASVAMWVAILVFALVTVVVLF